MCMMCRPLLKAIDAYLQKADNDLADEFEEEGYVQPKKTLKYLDDMEEQVAAALLAETDYILEAAKGAVDLEAFAADVWPGVKLSDELMSKLATVFTELLEKFMPEYIGYYIQQTDKDLELKQVSERTTAWVKTWSASLGEVMQLNSHNEIERILETGLKKGSSVEEFTRAILDSGIRDEHYKARRVAVTEVLRAHSVAQQEAFMQSRRLRRRCGSTRGRTGTTRERTTWTWTGSASPKTSRSSCGGLRAAPTTRCTQETPTSRRRRASTAIAFRSRW